jgi:hypothetical protein
MIEQDITFIGIRYKSSKKLIALDPSSGGYPYVVDTVKNAHRFNDEKDARSYAEMFNRPPNFHGDKMEVIRVTLMYELQVI